MKINKNKGKNKILNKASNRSNSTKEIHSLLVSVIILTILAINLFSTISLAGFDDITGKNNNSSIGIPSFSESQKSLPSYMKNTGTMILGWLYWLAVIAPIVAILIYLILGVLSSIGKNSEMRERSISGFIWVVVIVVIAGVSIAILMQILG